VVVHEGNPAERFFLLTSGQGRHFTLTRAGKKVILHWLTPGQVFAGAALASTPLNYLTSVELASDGCVWSWDRQTIRELVSRSPELLDNALSIALTEHVSWLIAANVSLSSDDARGRMAHLISSLACGIGRVTPEGIELPITNEDLANAAHVTQFTASRILRQWQNSGVVAKSRGALLLKKPELLGDFEETSL
jgi:CRP/FNR family transcriptional regulator